MARKKARQAEFAFSETWGGPRKGAGRKPKSEKAGVSHRRREEFSARCPLLVTMKIDRGLPSLRTGKTFRVLLGVFEECCESKDFRLTSWSVQDDHLHLICEARGKAQLSKAMQGLGIRMAKRLNKHWLRAGRVFADRYHSSILRSKAEVRNALVYVLHNGKKHHRNLVKATDPFSSAPWFDGWEESFWCEPACAQYQPVAKPRTWLLDKGWRTLGLLSIDEAPARRRRSARRSR